MQRLKTNQEAKERGEWNNMPEKQREELEKVKENRRIANKREGDNSDKQTYFKGKTAFLRSLGLRGDSAGEEVGRSAAVEGSAAEDPV